VAAIAIDDPAAAEQLKLLADADPATLSDEDKLFLSAAKVLRRGEKANDSLRDSIEQGRRYLKSVVDGKVVIVGWAAAGKLDFFPTSIHSACPGSVIQGVVFNSIVTNHMLRSRPWWVAGLFTALIGLICTAAVARLTPWQAFFAAGSAVSVYLLVNGLLFYDLGNQIVGVAGPVVCGGATWSLLTLSKFINETRERSRITRRFRSYVDPALVDFVIEHPERMSLEGEVREVTVAFTDLAGFTSIAESLQERAVPILNQYMGLMVPIIRKHDGLVNKFLGDGIMFFYGAPREHPHKARAAVQTVLEMNQALVPLNQQLRERRLPLVNMRAGIATGNVVVGDAGAIEGDQQASDYTVLGDRVNLAARLEAANKAFGTAVLIEKRTYELVRDEFLIRPIGRVKVKGKEEGVELYEPLVASAGGTTDQAAEVEMYRSMVSQYQRGELAVCRASVDAIQKRFGERKILELYRFLCEHFSQAEHRDAFTGDIVLTEK
jgi:adenylate cyclase